MQRIAEEEPWVPAPDPWGIQVRPRFRLRPWTLGVEVAKPFPGGEAVSVEAGLRLPPRRKRRGPRSNR